MCISQTTRTAPPIFLERKPLQAKLSGEKNIQTNWLQRYSQQREQYVGNTS